MTPRGRKRCRCLNGKLPDPHRPPPPEGSIRGHQPGGGGKDDTSRQEVEWTHTAGKRHSRRATQHQPIELSGAAVGSDQQLRSSPPHRKRHCSAVSLHWRRLFS